MMDSRRIISADRDGLICVWLAETGTLLQTIQGPYKSLAATNNMKFAVSVLLWDAHIPFRTTPNRNSVHLIKSIRRLRNDTLHINYGSHCEVPESLAHATNGNG